MNSVDDASRTIENCMDALLHANIIEITYAKQEIMKKKKKRNHIIVDH